MKINIVFLCVKKTLDFCLLFSIIYKVKDHRVHLLKYINSIVTVKLVE